MTAPLIPRHWWPALLRWWAVLGLSLLVVAFAAPRQYTASTTLLIKMDRLPWDTFKISKLPAYTPKAGSDDLQALAEELGGSAGVALWREVLFLFLMDQLAWDAYDFRPFLTARTTTAEAVRRAGTAEAFKEGSKPQDEWLDKVGSGLEVTIDKEQQRLIIEYTADDPQDAEAMAAAYRQLLLERINAMLDEKDSATLAHITQRVADVRLKLAELESRVADYQSEEALVAPARYLPARYAELLGLRERAARQQALAEAADTYVAVVEARSLAARQAEAQSALFDLGTDPLADRPPVSGIVYRDPLLARLREDLAYLLLEQERDLLLVTGQHPRVIGRAEEITQVRQAILTELVKDNQVEMYEYLLEAVTAHARATVYNEAADALEAKLAEFPRWEYELLSLLRERRVHSALYRRLLEIEDMAQLMIAKQETFLRPLEASHAAHKPSEPKLWLLGGALYLLGTMAATGWLAMRDKLGGA